LKKNKWQKRKNQKVEKNFEKKTKKKEKKGKAKKKKERKKKKKKEEEEEGRRITMDYCCNPQCFVCGGTVNPAHGLVY